MTSWTGGFLRTLETREAILSVMMETREAIASVSLSHPQSCRCDICKANSGDEQAMERVLAQLLATRAGEDNG